MDRQISNYRDQLPAYQIDKIRVRVSTVDSHTTLVPSALLS